MSLTVRLTILFACVLALVLAGFSWLVFRETSSRFHELDELLLQGKVQLVTEAARSSRTEKELSEWLATSIQGHSGLYIKVLSQNGDSFEHGEIQTPKGLAEEFADAGQDSDWRRTTHSFHAKRFDVRLGGENDRKLAVIAAVDTRQHKDFLDDLSIKTFGYMCFSVLVGSMLGWLASRGGLQPLMTMRTRAEQINGNRLSERIKARSWPKEMRELAKSLNGLLDRLQIDFDRLSAFSTNLAHEMRTPVNSILTVAQVTLAQPRTSDEYRKTIETISEALQDQARTISDMLFLAQTENMHALPSVQIVDLGLESRSLIDFYDIAANERGLTITLEGAAKVRGDRLMIRRAISNLLSNAVKYARYGSTIEIAINFFDGSPKLAISNQGEEIPVASQASLFDRFVRLSSPNAKEIGGLGLGLTITKAIMRAHHGQVQLRSSAGVNTFILEFEKMVHPAH